MQPLDPDDKRQPNVQIAASIRAAILTGELPPGSQLPSGHELAKFFGVSRAGCCWAFRSPKPWPSTPSGSGWWAWRWPL